MKKLLIIGDDVHSTRYISSILYNDEIELFLLDENDKTKDMINQYKIKKIKKEELKKKSNDFDYILYTLPNQFNKEIFDLLKDYQKVLLLEKPQLNLSLIKKLKCMIYLIHLRVFDHSNHKSKKRNVIEWPNLNQDGMDPIINTLPNIIDYLTTVTNTDEIAILKVNKHKDEIVIEFTIQQKSYVVKIYNTENMDFLPTINEEEIRWPNYFLCISELIENLLKNELNIEGSILKEEKQMELINEIRGEINGH